MKIKTAIVEPNLDLTIMDKRSKSPSLADATTKQKIGFISTIMLVIGSSVGAGIFIKNWNILTNVQNALLFAILSWVIAIIGALAMAFALIEICSGSGHANSQGVIGWVREFNSKFLYRASKNFMAYLHIPIISVIMSLYIVMVSQQAFGYDMPWWGAALVCLGLGMYHIWFVGLFSKVANISNWIVSMIEFVPILFACASGFIVLATHGLYDGASWTQPAVGTNGPTPLTSFIQMSLFCGVLSSIPAVFFSFDGFYSAAGLQTEMREPRKMPKAMTIGVTVVATLELIISISLLLGCQDGSLFGLNLENSPFPTILIQCLMVCVFVGMLSVMAGNAVYASRFYESLMQHDEMPFAKYFKHKLNTNKPVVGSCVTTILFTIVFLITFGGGYFFWDIGNYTSMVSITGESIYANDTHMGNILSFVDTYANWNALFAFACVTFSILGCLVNRKTHKVKTIKSRVFVPAAIVTVAIVGIGIIFVFISTIANFGISINNIVNPNSSIMDHPSINQWNANNPTNQIDTSTNLIGSIMSIVTLAVFCIIMFVPSYMLRHKEVVKFANNNRL